MRFPAPRRIGNRRSRRRLVLAAAVVIVLLILIGAFAGVYTDLLWYRSVGFSQVFRTEIATKSLMVTAFSALFAIVLLINLWIVQRTTSPSHLFTMRDQVLERYRLLSRPIVRNLVIIGSIVIGFFAGSSATGQWRTYLLFRHAQSFGIKDPVFSKDVSFFVFRLPFDRFLFTWGFSSLLVITIIVAAAHYLMGGIGVEGNSPRVAPHVKAHISVLLGLIVALKAWGYRLDQFGLNYSPRGGQVIGASYTDVHAQLPALKLLVFIAIACAILFFVNIRFRGWILPAAGLGILVLTSLIAGGIYPAAVQRFSVKPEERTKEQPYIKRNINFTREAFALEHRNTASQVTTLERTGAATLTPKALEQAPATEQNIRLWDPDTLIDAYTQLQRITPYYEFSNIGIDRYNIGGQTQQVMLSTREIDPTGLPDQARTWVNDHLFYTHGYGVVASRVNDTTPEGQPDFLSSGIPPTTSSDAASLAVTQPRIYFGLKETVPFVVANTKVPELDYPSGNTATQTTTYNGLGGIQLSNFFRRLAFAWKFKDVNLLISSAIQGNSRILYLRNIHDRVQKVAPYLQLDGDPYPVVVKGRILWVQDGYTTTEDYPYSQRIDVNSLTNGHLDGSVNYIRNSVKAVVDAFDGSVTLYVWDENDPIIKAWQSVFPTLLKPKSEMPAELVGHMRYPEDLFLIQADRYATYHITDPTDFYSKNDVWRIPDNPSCTGSTTTNLPASCQGTNKQIPPFYVFMNVPGETQPEMVLMLPFTPFGGDASTGGVRQNLTAWLAARMDGSHYGELLSLVYPKEKNVFGPEQIDALIENDPNVRSQKTQLDPKNERIIKGNLLVIPVGDSLLYVQPLYLRAASSTLPEFKRVVVATKDKIVIAGSLSDALSQLVSGLAPINVPSAPSKVNNSSLSALIADAINHYNAGQADLQRGDFAGYGREQAAMKRDLDKAQGLLTKK
ncbi:MAG: UPF0182 family membrane protein [Actinomycetota bacterium]